MIIISRKKSLIGAFEFVAAGESKPGPQSPASSSTDSERVRPKSKRHRRVIDSSSSSSQSSRSSSDNDADEKKKSKSPATSDPPQQQQQTQQQQGKQQQQPAAKKEKTELIFTPTITYEKKLSLGQVTDGSGKSSAKMTDDEEEPKRSSPRKSKV